MTEQEKEEEVLEEGLMVMMRLVWVLNLEEGYWELVKDQGARALREKIRKKKNHKYKKIINS